MELTELLASLDADQLRSILLRLVGRDPSLADRIERELGQIQAIATAADAGPTAAPPPPVTVNAAAIRRQVRAGLRGATPLIQRGGWGYGVDVPGEVLELLEEAWTLVRSGQGAAALATLEALADEYVEGWEALAEYDEEGEAASFFSELTPALTEALLTAELSSAERERWVEQLEAWQGEIANYAEADFDAAIAAARQGWDDPELQRLLRGEASELTGPSAPAGGDDHADEIDEDEADLDDRDAAEEAGRTYLYGQPDADDLLTVARLNVLQRQGRFEELLNLARATGQHLRYALALLQLGRIAEAESYATAAFTAPADSLALAQALLAHEDAGAAHRVGQHGHGQSGPKYNLATWLDPLASARGDSELALRAASTALQEQASLAGYQRVRELAGDEWPRRRERILHQLRGSQSYLHASGKLDIFLHEGLIDDAIAMADRDGGHALAERVVEAALTSRPAWAARASRHQAERIMNPGKAEYYHEAARWLAQARQAHHNAGTEDEWRSYLNGLLQQHHRKYKLRPLLEALRDR
jgi:uncharacterized Zn finger protein